MASCGGVRQRLATCGNGWQPAGNAMAGRVWKPVPRCKVGQRGKKLATLGLILYLAWFNSGPSWVPARVTAVANCAACRSKPRETVRPKFPGIVANELGSASQEIAKQQVRITE